MPAPEFFSVAPVSDVLESILNHWTPRRATEDLDTRHATGRILAVSPRSQIDLPEFIRSTMDGYAVRAADTFGSSQSLPAYLTCAYIVKMGQAPVFEIGPGQAAEIHTGAMLPRGADAVVMVERTQRVSETEIEILAPVAPGENLVQVGEDVTVGAPILSPGLRLRPQDIGGLLAVGILTVSVMASPRVGILSCGDELVPPEDVPEYGQIRDINAYTLAALVSDAGAVPHLGGIARDTLDDFQSKARAALDDADLLVITAGSSVSARDLTREVIAGLGNPGILQHGLAVKPGKPTIAAVCDGKPVIGLPGNPVSAFLVARQIVLPLVRHALGQAPRYVGTVQARLTANVASTTGREDTIPVRLSAGPEGVLAEPVFGKSNLIFTLMDADGLMVVPLNSNGLKAGAPVEVTLFG